jgi:DNA-directed RNA polymerase sigma subunit (sigma70/sigma32)
MNMKRASDDYCGILTDECGKYTIDPIGEMKRMADQALSDGSIFSRHYHVLKQRVPFPGVEKKSRKDIGKDHGVTEERIRQIEKRGCSTLKNYLNLKTEVVE